ncbi:MAG: hypothetical protein K2X00_19850, partial [Nitrospiraceae bacterium]|nr:hypothetical protein [Nitrospiraceae bacterium]
MLAKLDEIFWRAPSEQVTTWSYSDDDMASWLKNRQGFDYAVSGYNQNYGGQNEKWVRGSFSYWYFIKPDGSVYRWDGTANAASGYHFANLPTAYYDNPALLLTPPAAPSASISTTTNQLTSGSSSGTYVGDWWMETVKSGSPNVKVLYRLGFSDANGLGLNWAQEKVSTTSYSYDFAGQLSNVQQKKANGTNISNFTYTYDNAGNLKTEVLNGTTTTYGYDNGDQLTSDGVSTQTYDATGNRTNTGYSTTTGNRLSSDGTWNYSYDDEGNMTGKVKATGGTGENWTYTYDHENRMVKAEHRASTGTSIDLSATYKYDVYGNRIEKSADADGVGSGAAVVTKYAYEGFNPAKRRPIGNENWDVWADLTSAGAVSARYTRGDIVDQVFARMDASGNAYWLLTDRMGSVRDVIDSTGAVKDHINYDGFGNIISETDASFRGRYAWTGRELDAETGLQYNRARYYDPKTGRWTSQDPLGFDAGDSNLYRYASNRFVRSVDPSGL